MYFKQIAVPGLGCFSYAIGCPAAGAMAVVDPKRDIQDYLDIARDEGMRITHVIETHVHADHVSGNRDLREATGADIYFHESAPVKFEHKALREGDIIEIGAARMEVLHTPGHTPNSISLLVTDKQRSAEPGMLLTGDLLFVGDIGRPDLPGAEILDEQVANLYESLYVKLARHPDHMEVYPAHGQGSLCGRGMSAKQSSTLGYERRANPMLSFASFEEFRSEVLGQFPIRPKSFSHIIGTNMAGAPLTDQCPLKRSLSPEQFERAMAEGMTVIDTRDAAAFGGFHLPGSLNIGFEKQLANWVGMAVEPGTDILFVVESRERYEDMRRELLRIGYDQVHGWLAGGMSAWLLSGRPVESLAQISAADLRKRLDSGEALRVLDVRTPGERAAGHIPQARHTPLMDVLDSTGNGLGLPKDEEIIVTCGSGYRSNIAGSHLQRQGYAKISSLAGGFLAWSRAGNPVAR
ncbi:MBL fold metallo-hydrolase [Desulfocurvibacter africanus]|uniref:MBL fold metallo-hydrolase n=1 Tax=Desulfocurvibacter africanus TaxID=873 RepID=UPI002FD92D77